MPGPSPSRPPLDPSAVRLPGWRLEVLEESPSTNEHVAARARAGEPPGLVVVAEHQTSGRGRLDRVWVTPPRAALTFSVLVRPEGVPPARWPWLPLLAGLAVAGGVRKATGLEPVLKWPNDVLLRDDQQTERKVAGILVERVERPGDAVAVVGIGVNVTSTPDELPVGSATSLLLAGVDRPDRAVLLDRVLGTLGDLLDGWRDRGGDGLGPAYRTACSTIGRDVRVSLPTGATLEGRASGVDDEGRLLVDEGGRRHALGAGDVVHVRPVGGDR